MKRDAGIVLAVCLLVAGVHFAAGIRRPFLRHFESGGTQFGKHARNHVKFGLAKTRGIMLDVSGPDLGAYDRWKDYFYPSHGPVSALAIAAAMAGFGTGEAVIRVVSLGWTMLAVVLFWRVARRRLESPYDLVATGMFALNPMFCYFSVVTVHQANTMSGILAAILFYLRWRENGRRREIAAMCASIVFACLCDWPGYYAAPAICVAHFFGVRERRFRMAPLLGLNVAVFGAYLLYLYALDPERQEAMRMLLQVGPARSNPMVVPATGYLAGEVRKVAIYFTIPLVALAVLGLVARRRDAFLWSMLLLSLDHVVFVKITSQHDYYVYYLGVFFALAGAEGVRFLRGRLAWISWAAAALFVAQSAWILQNRLTREGAYFYYFLAARAIAEKTEPQDRVFLLTDDMRFYTPYYADRYAVWYDRRTQTLVPENCGGWIQTDPEAVKDLLRRNPHRFRYVVTADPATIGEHVPFLRDASPDLLRRFRADDDFTPFLQSICPPPERRNGFLFWPMRL